MNAPLVVRLRESLAARYQAPIELAAVSTQSNSTVFMARVKTDPEVRLAVKCCHIPGTAEPNCQVATDQFNAFKKVGDAFSASTPQFRVPAVVFVDTPLAAIGMRWIEGKSLTNRLASPFALLRLRSSMESAGAWLGHFHRVGPLREGRFNYVERQDHVARLIAHPLANGIFRRAAQSLAESRDVVESQPVRVSWLHGDCKADNIFFADHATFGIDISIAHENCVEHDIAQFLNHLNLQFLHPRFLHNAALTSFIEAAFWKGYRSTGPEVSTACLAWIRLWGLLELWESTLRVRNGSGLSSWAANHAFARVCQRLTERTALLPKHGGAPAALGGPPHRGEPRPPMPQESSTIEPLEE